MKLQAIAASKGKKILHKLKTIKMKLIGAEVADLRAVLTLHSGYTVEHL